MAQDDLHTFSTACLLFETLQYCLKTHEKQLLYDPLLSPLISLWNIITQVEVLWVFSRKREAP